MIYEIIWDHMSEVTHSYFLIFFDRWLNILDGAGGLVMVCQYGDRHHLPQPNEGHPRNVPGCGDAVVDKWWHRMTSHAVGPIAQWFPVGIRSICQNCGWENPFASSRGARICWHLAAILNQPWTRNLQESFMYVLLSRCRNIRSKPCTIATYCNLKVLNPRVCRLSEFVRPSFMQTLTLPVQALLDYATNCALWNLNPTFLFKGHYDHLWSSWDIRDRCFIQLDSCWSQNGNIWQHCNSTRSTSHLSPIRWVRVSWQVIQEKTDYVEL